MLHTTWPVTILKWYKYGYLYYIIFGGPLPPRFTFPCFISEYSLIIIIIIIIISKLSYFLQSDITVLTEIWMNLEVKMFRFQILTSFSLAVEPTRKEPTAVTLVTDVPGTCNG